MLDLSPVVNWVDISMEKKALAGVIYQGFEKYEIVTIRTIELGGLIELWKKVIKIWGQLIAN